MKRWYHRGLSLLELMLSLTILFLVSLYCMSMFATGQSHFVRAQQYSQSSFLVNAKLQELLAVPFKDLAPSSGKFPVPYDDFSYAVTLDPYELDMTRISVEVTSRRGAVARATTLVTDDQGFAGVAVDPATHQQAYAGGDRLNFTEDGSASKTSDPSPLGAVGGVGGRPGSNLLWALNRDNGLVKYLEADGWQAPVAAPTGAQLTPLITGLASNGSFVYVGDSNNRCVWVLEDSATPAWRGSYRAKEPPLGSVSGVAADSYGSIVWVADRENQCLRKLLLTPTPGYPGAELETVDTGTHWHKKRYAPPGTVGMGSPHGIAMDPSGYGVFVVDRGRLYQFTDSGGDGEWKVLCTFPTGLVTARPSGLALDPFQNVLYIGSMNGHLWRFKLGESTVTPL